MQFRGPVVVAPSWTGPPGRKVSPDSWKGQQVEGARPPPMRPMGHAHAGAPMGHQATRLPAQPNRQHPMKRPTYCVHCGSVEMFGTIGCYNCYLMRTVLIPARLGVAPVAPGDRRRRTAQGPVAGQQSVHPHVHHHAPAPQPHPHPPPQAQPQHAVPPLAPQRVSPSSLRRFIPPPVRSGTTNPSSVHHAQKQSPPRALAVLPQMPRVRHTASDPSNLCTSAAQGKRVKLVGCESLGPSYANRTGVVTGSFGNSGPREVAVKLDNGRTEFFARRYLQMLTPPTSPLANQQSSSQSPTILQIAAENRQKRLEQKNANTPAENNLPEGWIVLKPGHPRYDKAEAGRIYYHHKATNRVQYEHPAKTLIREQRAAMRVMTDVRHGMPVSANIAGATGL